MVGDGEVALPPDIEIQVNEGGDFPPPCIEIGVNGG